MSLDLPADGPAAPPRANGELVFTSPWESRVFGVTAALAEDGRLRWPEFQTALIERIPDHLEVEVETGAAAAGYWRAWLAALVDISERHGVLASDQISVRAEELAARPVGHDH